MNIDDPTLQSVVEEFKKTGWLMAILGAFGMLARLILTNEKFKAVIWTRKIIAGGIVGVLCYFTLFQIDIDAMYRCALCSIAGSLAPEVFDFVRNKFLNTVKS